MGFVNSLASRGDRIALATDGEALTYAELADRVDGAAADLGASRRLVLIAGANRLESVVAYLGALRGGHVPLLVPDGPEAHVAELVAAFDPDVVVRAAEGMAERRADSAHELHPDLALLLSTSGSTGSPRLVRLSHANLQSNAEAVASYLEIDDDDRAITSLPLHYCYGLSVLHSHLAHGAGVVLTDRSVVDPCFWELFRAHRCTNLSGVPHTFELLDRIGFDRLDLPTLRFVTQAGGRMDPAAVRRYAALGVRDGWDLVVMYGQTEATARMAYLPPSLTAEHPESIGVAIPGGTLRIDPIGDDPDVGELVYAGPNVMLGYAERPEDLALGRTVTELRTGDLARRRPTGLLEIVGRINRFAKVAGLRIDLEQVERRLRAEGHTVLCASDDHQLVVGREARPGRALPVADRAALASGLPLSRIRLIELDELPRRPNGKPDPAALLALAAAPVAPIAPVTPVGCRGTAPPDGVDPGVWTAFADVLGNDATAVTGEATFVSLGGDSLSYVEVSIALEAQLGLLPPDWHLRPIATLRPGVASRRWGRVETSVLLRAAAIVLVVSNHATGLGLLGGAHVLLGVAGWNYARFSTGTRSRLRSLARIAIPSMAWLGLNAALDDRIHLDHALLVHSWLGHEGHSGYWYVDAAVQILLVLAGLLAVPAVGRWAGRHPFAFPVGLALASLAVRFDLLGIPRPEPHDIRPHDILWIFALGWAGAAARTDGARLLVTALVVGAVPGYFGEPQREVFVVVGLLLLLWVPTIPLPRRLLRPIGRVAAASLAIYLTHWQVFPPVRDALGAEASVMASLVVGTAAWWAGVRLVGVVRRLTARRGVQSVEPASPPDSGGYAAATSPA